MMIFLIISNILLLLYTIPSLIINLRERRRVKHQFDLSELNTAQLEAMGAIKAKKNAYEKEIKDEIDQEVENARAAAQEQISFEEKETQRRLEALNQQEKDFQRTINARLKQSQEQFEERLEHYKNLDTAAQRKREEENAVKLLEEQNRYQSSLAALQADYKEKKEELETNFFNYNAGINLRKEALDKEIKTYEDKQKEIIARFKADEEKKQQMDFYRVQLKEQDREDIKRLQQVAETLNSPIVLYKLIWENYYKNPFSQMVGRVVPSGTKCGIYKITNIENGKVYIGQTRQEIGKRWRDHIRRGVRAEPSTKNKLYEEMWDIGPENFTFEIITTCTPEELNEKEKYFIEFYQAQMWGYNGTKGGS